MARLSAAARKKLPAGAFVFPDSRSYPIHDANHARIALTDASGTAAEGAVKAKVRKMYPGIKVS
jgi:hypothetical protein